MESETQILMKTSPHRPRILKRQRLPLPVQEAPAQQEPRLPRKWQSPPLAMVAIPNNANIQSILTALTAKGKESGSNGPNKSILISCGGAPLTLQNPSLKPKPAMIREGRRDHQDPGTRTCIYGSGTRLGQRWENCAGGEAAGCALNTSLTNIQWLGKMSSGVGSCGIKQEVEGKENQYLEPNQRINILADSVSERPPYSYMAMIQFAINSSERKHMTLKGIYTWIKDNFPYFKHMAKPGWKNPICHNLSLLDTFVRETSANGKVSFWTIHPSANRYLTLEQVFKQQK
ncbi:hypothetical protein QTO34_001631 [Cnephaeus nilssonii]|uniref:Forkhead box protein M1 n=1 Tax=Cnephaeus nilssonii TaxID=3371016 RepID=A0AA40HW77_CNENI|nr:hypothetical protein QTO34_001631 [Eptesicus nilssonii]